MSEKHTLGPLECQRHDEREGSYHTLQGTVNGRSGVVADTLNRDYVLDPDEDAANAARLAACWNACAGLDDAALAELPKLFASYTAAVKARDELLAACEAWLWHLPDLDEILGQSYAGLTAKRLLGQTRLAVENAKKGV